MCVTQVHTISISELLVGYPRLNLVFVDLGSDERKAASGAWGQRRVRRIPSVSNEQ